MTTSGATPSTPTHHLSFERYGKAEVHLAHVDRSGPRHVLSDVTATTALRGDHAASYTDGDNTGVLPTDSQKNLVHAVARQHGVGAPEDFAARLARALLDAAGRASTAEVDLRVAPWTRMGAAGGAGGEHSFTSGGAEVRTARAVARRGGPLALWGGLDHLVVLKTTGSGYSGFLQGPLTTLPETDERILATSVRATWRYAGGAADAAGGGAGGTAGAPAFAAVAEAARAAMLRAFGDLHSLALQQTLLAMGSAALDAAPELEEVALVMPNRHHVLVDLAPLGLDNPQAVYRVDDRPYGLIEGTVVRGRP